jgi:hypothetical protein
VTPRRRLLSLVALAMLAGGCGDAASTPTRDPGASLEPSPTGAPPGTDAPASNGPSAAPTAAPTDAPSEPAPSGTPSDEPDPAAASCAGSDANREFFAQVAGAVDWAVYCPVLPAGWFVEGGEYRLAGGGWLEITYEGPDGSSVQLRQGAPCETAGCQPSGADLGEAAYGDLAGILLDVGNGGFAVVVDPGENPSWTLVAESLAADDVRRIAADLTLVEG